MHRLATLTVSAVFAASPVLAQHDHAIAGQALGAVSFPTSCASAVQPRIDRAVAMLHSFWFDEAHNMFVEIAAEDSTCAMAHWGIAMTAWGNPFVRQPIAAEQQRVGLAAAEHAISLAGRASHRERMYIEAAAVLWRDAAQLDHLARLGRHESAMKSLNDAHPDDSEAAIFHARAIIANAPPTDLDSRRQLHAAAILEPLFAMQPDHPGLAHYVIHAFDSPRLASHGLEAARRYASIAPAAPHALHMPSHIFTRLGYWDESIETNRRSAAAEPDSNAAVHPNDYMVYAYLQQGRDAEAWKVIARTRGTVDRFYGAVLGYNAVAMQARYALERSAWREAAMLAVPGGSAPFIEAVARFARAIGAARSADVASAGVEVAALATLRDTLKARNDGYWATIVEAQRLAAAAWIARAQGRVEDAVRLAREGADLEETVEKHPVTPGPLLPARELEGDLLLELGRSNDAMLAFEATLAREPGRARALFGIARAAEKAGNAAVARARYIELLDLMRRADSSRVEVRVAREYLDR
ncbi:MAG: hypothetical protein ACRENI_03225 [Gemmatimonadaceae bacterium]